MVNAVDGRSNTTVDVFTREMRPIKLKLGDIYGEYVEVLNGAKVGQSIKVRAFSNVAESARSTPLLFKKNK